MRALVEAAVIKGVRRSACLGIVAFVYYTATELLSHTVYFPF